MTRLFAPSFSGFRRSWVRPDLVAGLTVWAVLVPESLAYATIAGVPPVVGLYAAVPALTLYAVLGTSRHLVVSPMSATAALSAGTIATIAPAQSDASTVLALTAGLALATGVSALVAGSLRLGFLASFISAPVLKGFIIGLALTILIGQVPDLLGTSKGSGNFFEKGTHVLTHLDETDLLTVGVGFGGLLLLVALRRFLPLVPGSLVVALGGIALVWAFGLDDRGLEVVGQIDAGLPQLGLPDLSAGQWRDLAAASVGVMLVGFAEGLGAAKTYAAREGYDIDPNRELLGLGAANLGSGLASGMVVNGSLSKTAVNGGAGARSELSALTAAALSVVTLLFLTGLFERLPDAVLAAIVIMAVVELVDVRSLRRLWRVRSGHLARLYSLASRADFLASMAALLGVLVFDTLPGLAIGIAMSLVLLVARTSRPRVAVLVPVDDPSQLASRQGPRLWVDAERHPQLARPDDVLVIRVEAPLFFGNAEYVRDRVRDDVLQQQREGAPVRLVVLDGRSTPSIDVTAADMLVQLRTDLRRLGVHLRLAGDVGQVRDVLKTADTGEPLVHADIDAAIAAEGAASPQHLHSRESGEGEASAADDSGQEPTDHREHPWPP